MNISINDKRFAEVNRLYSIITDGIKKELKLLKILNEYYEEFYETIIKDAYQTPNL